MLIKMFSIDVTSSANQFQEQLEQTADIVIKRLEEQIIHVEYLLEEANEKIAMLDNKIQMANKISNTINVVIPEVTIEENEMIPPTQNSNLAVAVTKKTGLSSLNYKYIVGSDKRSSVVEMADLGYGITEIAKTTGISKGEIMLLLQLNKK